MLLLVVERLYGSKVADGKWPCEWGREAELLWPHRRQQRTCLRERTRRRNRECYQGEREVEGNIVQEQGR